MKTFLFCLFMTLLCCTSANAASDEDVPSFNVGSFGSFVVDYLKKHPDVKELKLYQCVGKGLTKELRCRSLRPEPHSVSRDRVLDKSSRCDELGGKIQGHSRGMNWHPDNAPWQMAYHVSDTPDVSTSGYYVVLDMNTVEFAEVLAFSENHVAKYFWEIRVTKDFYGYSERMGDNGSSNYDDIRRAQTYFKFIPIIVKK